MSKIDSPIGEGKIVSFDDFLSKKKERSSNHREVVQLKGVEEVIKIEEEPDSNFPSPIVKGIQEKVDGVLYLNDFFERGLLRENPKKILSDRMHTEFVETFVREKNVEESLIGRLSSKYNHLAAPNQAAFLSLEAVNELFKQIKSAGAKNYDHYKLEKIFVAEVHFLYICLLAWEKINSDKVLITEEIESFFDAMKKFESNFQVFINLDLIINSEDLIRHKNLEKLKKIISEILNGIKNLLPFSAS